MVLPNLLIVGAQKCGTTWLHQALSLSSSFWGTQQKELSFWNQRERDIADYEAHFSDAPATAKYRFESTPHYFRLPNHGIDVAANIKDGMGDVPMILVLRDPTQRYLSAYTHNILRGRLENQKLLTEINYDHSMVKFGYYSSILKHFRQHFSRIETYFYDDLSKDNFGFVSRIMTDFDTPCDITKEQLDFRANDTKKRQANKGLDYLPKLSPDLEKELRAHYHDEVLELADMTGRKLDHWL